MFGHPTMHYDSGMDRNVWQHQAAPRDYDTSAAAQAQQMLDRDAMSYVGPAPLKMEFEYARGGKRPPPMTKSSKTWTSAGPGPVRELDVTDDTEFAVALRAGVKAYFYCTSSLGRGEHVSDPDGFEKLKQESDTAIVRVSETMRGSRHEARELVRRTCDAMVAAGDVSWFD